MTVSSPRRIAWAVGLVAAVVACAVHVTTQVGGSSCVRHDLGSLAAHDATSPEVGPVMDGEAAHPPCAACAAPTGGASAARHVTVDAPATCGLDTTDTPAGGLRDPRVPPLAYAPKTSPPIA